MLDRRILIFVVISRRLERILLLFDQQKIKKLEHRAIDIDVRKVPDKNTENNEHGIHEPSHISEEVQKRIINSLKTGRFVINAKIANKKRVAALV